MPEEIRDAAKEEIIARIRAPMQEDVATPSNPFTWPQPNEPYRQYPHIQFDTPNPTDPRFYCMPSENIPKNFIFGFSGGFQNLFDEKSIKNAVLTKLS